MQEWTVPFGSQINDRVRNKNFRYDTIMTSPSHSNMSCRHVRAAPGRGGATEHLGRPGLWMGRPTRS